MRYIVVLTFICLSLHVFSQAKRDTALANRIKEMYKADQKWRKVFQVKKEGYDDAAIEANLERTDNVNMIAAKQIIDRYGYPGYDLIGESGSSRFWAIVQHCDDDVAFQQKVLKLMYEQVKRKNASGENYAYLEDRVLIGTHRKQLYGTQLRFDPVTRKSSAYPIADPANVDARRKLVGMGTLAEYIKMNDSYH